MGQVGRVRSATVGTARISTSGDPAEPQFDNSDSSSPTARHSMASTTSAANSRPVSVIFVCLGNICRSPMAEAVFQHLAKPPSAPFAHKPLVGRIDSAGTGAYHLGHPPDQRTMLTLKKHGISAYTHLARKFTVSDLTAFDYILAMDEENMEYLQEVKSRAARQGKLKVDQIGKIMLFGDFGEVEGEEVVDPYYGGVDGFQIAYEQLLRFSEGFLRSVGKNVAASSSGGG